jgi:hypothetical protein
LRIGVNFGPEWTIVIGGFCRIETTFKAFVCRAATLCGSDPFFAGERFGRNDKEHG